jgi:shikimate dehydrogenase
VSSSSLQDVVCVLGHPAVGDPTQFMMERAFQQAGLDWRYLTFDVAPEQLGAALRGVHALGLRGCQLAMPHGQTAVPELPQLTASAELAGAVNVVARDDGHLIGENTVGRGFLAGLRDLTDPQGKRVVLFGAGAAAAAIAAELIQAGIGQLTIVNRTLEKAEQLAERLRKQSQIEIVTTAWVGDFAIAPETEMVVHATSLNHFDLDARLAVKWPAVSQLVVADISYNPVEPRWMLEVKERGFVRLGGLTTFVNQSALVYQFWTGEPADRDLLRDAVEEFFG